MSSFITLGDWGGFALGSFHETTVTKVAKQMAATATAAGGIDFLVNTGDNFYYCGIQNTSDYQIAEDFTKPYGAYSSLNVPWYGVLGNHEYGYNVEAQIQLSQAHPLWVMDARYYTRRVAVDEGASHVRVAHNLVHHTLSAGLHQHYGFNNSVVRNVFACAGGTDGDLALSIGEAHTSFAFEANVVQGFGGGVFVKDSGTNPSFEGCTFRSNQAPKSDRSRQRASCVRQKQ